MGKASRSKRDPGSRDERNRDRLVGAYFARAGVTQPPNGERLWAEIETRLSRRFMDELAEAVGHREEMISAGEVPDDAVYELLYRDLDAALLTMPVMTPMARVWLRHFVSLDLPAGPQLDIGSGNGFLTCFYATLRPDEEVLGIDRSAAGVRCGTELAERLGLTNVTFRQQDLLDGEAVPAADAGRFAVVTSVASLRDLEPSRPGPADPFSWLTSGAAHLADASSVLVDIVDRRLGEGGAFVSLERLATFGDVAWWVGAMQCGGLVVDLDASAHVAWTMPPYGHQSMPAIVARKGHGAGAPIGARSGSAPSEGASERPQMLGVADLATWYDKQQIQGTEIRLELLIASGARFSVVDGHHIDVSDTRREGQTRIYLLENDERAIVYMTTNRGARELLGEAPDVDAMRPFFDDVVSKFTAMPEVVDHHRLERADDDIARFVD